MSSSSTFSISPMLFTIFSTSSLLPFAPEFIKTFKPLILLLKSSSSEFFSRYSNSNGERVAAPLEFFATLICNFCNSLPKFSRGIFLNNFSICSESFSVLSDIFHQPKARSRELANADFPLPTKPGLFKIENLLKF